MNRVSGRVSVAHLCGHVRIHEYETIQSQAEAERSIILRSAGHVCIDCQIAARRYRLGSVLIDEIIPAIPAYVLNERWNGWAMPAFTREQAEVYRTYQPQARYDAALDAYVIQLEGNDEPDVFPGEDIQVDGQTIHVYPIGAGCWIWEEPS